MDEMQPANGQQVDTPFTVPAMNYQACWQAAERLASKFPNLRVADDDAVMPLSTAMYLRVVLCVVDAYEDR